MFLRNRALVRLAAGPYRRAIVAWRGGRRALAAAALGGTLLLPAAEPAGPQGAFSAHRAGRLVAEAESAPAISEWRLETEHAGYTGRGYYAWRGPEAVAPAGAATLDYRVAIPQAGRYTLAIRARRDQEGRARANDEANDVFVRVNGQGAWMKLSHKTAWGQWGWMRTFSYRHGLDDAIIEFEAGEHVIEIAARSGDVKIDALHLAIVEEGCGCS